MKEVDEIYRKYFEEEKNKILKVRLNIIHMKKSIYTKKVIEHIKKRKNELGVE